LSSIRKNPFCISTHSHSSYFSLITSLTFLYPHKSYSSLSLPFCLKSSLYSHPNTKISQPSSLKVSYTSSAPLNGRSCWFPICLSSYSKLPISALCLLLLVWAKSILVYCHWKRSVLWISIVILLPIMENKLLWYLKDSMTSCHLHATLTLKNMSNRCFKSHCSSHLFLPNKGYLPLIHSWLNLSRQWCFKPLKTIIMLWIKWNSFFNSMNRQELILSVPRWPTFMSNRLIQK